MFIFPQPTSIKVPTIERTIFLRNLFEVIVNTYVSSSFFQINFVILQLLVKVSVLTLEKEVKSCSPN